MKKSKTILLAVIMLLVLVLGGFTPFFTATVVDGWSRDKVSSTALCSVKLEPGSGQTRLTLEEKLALLHALESSKNVSMQYLHTEELDVDHMNQIIQSTQEQLDFLINTGLLPDGWHNDALTGADACLIYVPHAPEHNTVVWAIGWRSKGNWEIGAVVDNETGMILELWSEHTPLDIQDPGTVLDMMQRLYFSSLGIEVLRVDTYLQEDRGEYICYIAVGEEKVPVKLTVAPDRLGIWVQ